MTEPACSKEGAWHGKRGGKVAEGTTLNSISWPSWTPPGVSVEACHGIACACSRSARDRVCEQAGRGRDHTTGPSSDHDGTTATKSASAIGFSYCHITSQCRHLVRLTCTTSENVAFPNENFSSL